MRLLEVGPPNFPRMFITVNLSLQAKGTPSSVNNDFGIFMIIGIGIFITNERLGPFNIKFTI